MPVAQAQQRDDGEVRAGRVAADRQSSFVVLEQPESSGLAVVGRRGIGMLGRQPVVDADRRQPGRLRHLPEMRVLHVGAADRPAAAVEVQVCAPRLGRLEHAQRDLAARPVDGDGARLLEVDRRGQRAAACALRLPRHSRRQLVDFRHRRDQLLELQVEGAGLRQDLVSGHTGRLRRRAPTARRDGE